MVGGAEEALEAKKDDFSLIIKNRKGFVKIAIQNGADLVPIYAFGENELFDQLDNSEGTKMRKF